MIAAAPDLAANRHSFNNATIGRLARVRNAVSMNHEAVAAKGMGAIDWEQTHGISASVRMHERCAYSIFPSWDGANIWRALHG